MSLHEVFTTILEGLEMPFSYLANPNKRIFGLYLFSSFLLAYYVYTKSKIQYSFLKYVFQKEVWLSKSAMVDYGMVFFNSFVKILLIGPYVIYGLYIAFYVDDYMHRTFGYEAFHLTPMQALVLYTIALTLIGDFTSFIVHYAMHKVSFFWEFHKIHHSATVLNPVTQYRIHPIELIVNNVRSILVFGLVTGVFDYLSANEVHKMMFLGANVFSFLFFFWGANLRHSHIPLKYFNFLEYFLISPFQHQVHHSDNPQHFDKNMGSKLAIWDWAFGTLVRSKSVESLKFGLGNGQDGLYDSFWKNLYMPFWNIFLSLKAYIVGR